MPPITNRLEWNPNGNEKKRGDGGSLYFSRRGILNSYEIASIDIAHRVRYFV